MSITVTVRDDQVTEGMKRYAREKGDKLHRFFDGITKTEVILTAEGPLSRAEIIVSVPRSERIATHVDHEKMNAAIDLAIDKAEKCLVRHKEKLKSHRTNGNGPPMPAEEPAEELESYQEIIDRTDF